LHEKSPEAGPEFFERLALCGDSAYLLRNFLSCAKPVVQLATPGPILFGTGYVRLRTLVEAWPDHVRSEPSLVYEDKGAEVLRIIGGWLHDSSDATWFLVDESHKLIVRSPNEQSVYRY
jgi:hypothetical protein